MGNYICFAHTGYQPGRNLLQHLIAHRRTETVVDLFEPVQADIQYGNTLLVSLCFFQQPLQPVDEEFAVSGAQLLTNRRPDEVATLYRRLKQAGLELRAFKERAS